MVLKRYVSSCVLLALSACAFSGEIETGITLDTSIYKTDVKSGLESVDREDFASVTDVTLTGNYDSTLFKSSLTAVGTNVDFSGDADEGNSEIDFTWSNWLYLMDETLVLSGSIIQERPELSFFNSGVKDRVYSTESEGESTVLNYSANYELKPTLPINGYFNHEYSRRSIDWDDNRLEAREYEVESTQVALGQYKESGGVYWMLAVGQNKDGKYASGDIDSIQGSSLIRIPLLHQWYVVANNEYSTYKNSKQQVDSVIDKEKFTTRNIGAGLVWAKDHSKAYFQLTREKDTVRDSYFFGVDAKWPFSEKLSTSASLNRKFYGDSKYFDLAYQHKDNRLMLSHNEVVDMRYVLTANQVVEGVYVCDIPLEGEDFNNETCLLPTGLNFDIEPGKFIQTRFETVFPLIERLTLNKVNSALWEYTMGNWSHRFSYRDTKTKNIEVSGGQTKKTFSFSAIQRLNELSSLSLEFKDIDLSFLSGEKERKSKTRIYNIGLTNELNSKASWGIFFERITRGDEYIDNRVYLQYIHHFGVDNKNIRPMK